MRADRGFIAVFAAYAVRPLASGSSGLKRVIFVSVLALISLLLPAYATAGSRCTGS